MTKAISAVLYPHKHKYFPYEVEFARRELQPIADNLPNWDASAPLVLPNVKRNAIGLLRELVYFSGYTVSTNPDVVVPTIQAELEDSHSSTRSSNGTRQQTRYAVHGMHEYKGKFNPQVVRGILNSFALRSSTRILDPFCGSGTSLIEAAIGKKSAVGCDRNPFAIFLANAKCAALATPAHVALDWALKSFGARPRHTPFNRSNQSWDYLNRWFPSDHLEIIEGVRAFALERVPEAVSPIVLALASDLLRDYSLQEPRDLRIRRRFSPMPALPLRDALAAKAKDFFSSLAAAQSRAGEEAARWPRNIAVYADSSQPLHPILGRKLFDAAITSPPYATALPYIDTQRLSLLWLDLIEPSALRESESSLIGSRDLTRGESSDLMEAMHTNRDGLPGPCIDLCLSISKALSPSDGFRRQATPSLLYRYFVSMRSSFMTTARALRRGAPYALIVGTNRASTKSQTFQIDTPDLLATLAASVGWSVKELLDLDAYPRYDLHARNSVRHEALVLLANR